MSSGLAPSNPNESAILMTLSATSSGTTFTAVMRSVDGTMESGWWKFTISMSGPGSSLLNISTRGNVQTGDNVMIGGFIVAGNGSQRVLVRGDRAIWGHSAWPIRWRTRSSNCTMRWRPDRLERQLDGQPGGGRDRGHHDRAKRSEGIGRLQTLAPGAYTAIVQGAGGTTGTGLVEVYVLPPAS